MNEFGVIDVQDLRECKAKELDEEKFNQQAIIYIKEENEFRRLKLNIDLYNTSTWIREYLKKKSRNHLIFVRKNKPFKDFTA